MLELLLRDGAVWFTVPALVGTTVFVLRLVMMVVGLAGHDLAMDVHADAGGESGHGDPSEAFKVLSVQSIAAFCMGFGWGGLGALVGAGLAMPASIVSGLAVGAGMMWLLARMFRFMRRLQSSGNIEIQDVVGRDAAVYLTVPAKGGGRGQVRIALEDRERFYEAVSDGEAIETGARARIVRANPDNTVTVSRASV
jgi:membrane protein implicated in regulation of membrane protease activity